MSRPGPPPKLTREQAIAIRETYRRGTGYASLAVRYAVSEKTISRVIKGLHQSAEGLPDIARPPLRGMPGKFTVDSGRTW